jgi:MFS family permease
MAMDAGREQRTIKADRRARMVVMAGCAGAVLLGLVLVAWVIPRGQDYLQRQEPHVSLRVLQIFTALIFLSFLPVSGYMFWFGRRVARSRQMPPPGTRVIRDTRVIAGERAVTRGRGMMLVAVVLSAVCLFAGIWLPIKFGRVFAASVQEQTHDVPESSTGKVPAANDVTP